jgi:tetratricopeptide (TPR) repeat protein
MQISEESKEKKIQDEKSTDLEDNLDELAEKISQAKIPVIKPALSADREEKSSNQYEPDESALGGERSMIVSETLAKIYIAQGEIKEAITVYEKLKKKEPAREDYFSQKIAELKSKL